jgi:hypothetical protein
MAPSGGALDGTPHGGRHSPGANAEKMVQGGQAAPAAGRWSGPPT